MTVKRSTSEPMLTASDPRQTGIAVWISSRIQGGIVLPFGGIRGTDARVRAHKGMACHEEEHRSQGADAHTPDYCRRSELGEQSFRSCRASGTDAEDGAVPGIAFQPQGIGSTGKSDAAHQPDQRLKDLGEGGGDHIALSLIVSPVNRNHTTAEDRRGNGKNCRRSAGISGKIGKKLSEGKDSHSAQDTGDAHQSQGCPEGAAGIGKTPGCHCLGYHLGHRHRDSRYCQGTHRIEEIIGGHEVAHAGAADDIGKRHLEKGADELDDQG